MLHLDWGQGGIECIGRLRTVGRNRGRCRHRWRGWWGLYNGSWRRWNGYDRIPVCRAVRTRRVRSIRALLRSGFVARGRSGM